jgi:hypothetical protein
MVQPSLRDAATDWRVPWAEAHGSRGCSDLSGQWFLMLNTCPPQLRLQAPTVWFPAWGEPNTTASHPICQILAKRARCGGCAGIIVETKLKTATRATVEGGRTVTLVIWRYAVIQPWRQTYALVRRATQIRVTAARTGKFACNNLHTRRCGLTTRSRHGGTRGNCNRKHPAASR